VLNNKGGNHLAKKIAIVVRLRQDEALRMAVGMILLDDAIDVYVLDLKVSENEDNALNLETMDDMDIGKYTNLASNEGMELLSNAEIASKLLSYDHVLMY
jgi:hypothetical protein